ncbi:Cyclic pyranopterin monophosphate synthase [Pelotomaculum schinkii]|uniref:Cyclic pyranopterin monophosphate synthase n=1 Tax=Pelotomaculum schinkii TaxID=78350 RepID=A0A4Y7RHC3_9FIRM|nr:radical SAM (seleno)protein TrsS [Pelotomaculum schinkii]TEB08092.1 Cyclic pyranopterin monophosphate synthase [Pelotomaculum schinkii]
MNKFTSVIHITESLCPVCLKRIPARHVLVDEDIYMQKTCEKHGDFSTIIWRGQSEPYYTSWKKNKWPVHLQRCLTEVEKGCPFDCGLCAEHRQQTCCALLEVTQRCNLNCNFCFASSGGNIADPSFDKIREWLKILVEAGKPFIHISGGEPTVRNDLPEIIRMINEMGFPYIQLNTNGLRLSREPEYVKILKQAGLSSVFMQFDGTKDEIHQQLRGRNLLAEKENAIKNCGDNNLGIVLVPTIVPGVNMDNIGEIIRFGLSKVPDVRGIHFQPVSYFGRYPSPPLDNQRITLPEVLREIENQTGGKFQVDHFAPSGCDHARCGFHGDFVVMPDGSIKQLTIKNEEGCCCNKKTDSSGVEKNRNFVARRWVRESSQNNQRLNKLDYELDELDIFIARVKSHGFTITGMTFQDCWNVDLERLHECSLHVLSPEGKIIPFCAYNISSIEGKSLYRKNVLAPPFK